MTQPEKWRETCDPFGLPFRAFEPREILGYPHAGNDVFHMRGRYRDQTVEAYVKVARQRDAGIENEISVLSQLRAPIFPRVIDHGASPVPFSVTLALPGERLSVLLGDNGRLGSLAYLPEYGQALAWMHRQTPSCAKVADRRFFHAPSRQALARVGLEALEDYFVQLPPHATECFCHGDFHYANVLWQEGHISGILDFELSGYGDRDFDIAWALFLRPGQRFLRTETEQLAFLEGYARSGTYDPAAVRYYMAQCYVHFLQFSGDDSDYTDYVRAWLDKLL